MYLLQRNKNINIYQVSHICLRCTSKEHNPYKNKKQVAIYKYCYTLAHENVPKYGFISSLNYSLYIL